MQVRGAARSRDLTAILPDANTVALDLFLRCHFFDLSESSETEGGQTGLVSSIRQLGPPK